MPTKEETEELIDNCTFVWGTQNGVDGMYAIGPNGNAIFLPTAYIEYVYMGEWEGKAEYMENSNNPQLGFGEFWTSTQDDNGKVDYMSFFQRNTWARQEQGDIEEWAIFRYPDGKKVQLRYEKADLPKMQSHDELKWRKTIRPVKE